MAFTTFYKEEAEEVCGPGGGAARVEALGVRSVGAVFELVLVYISIA
jgi:hypothetical protein